MVLNPFVRRCTCIWYTQDATMSARDLLCLAMKTFYMEKAVINYL